MLMGFFFWRDFCFSIFFGVCNPGVWVAFSLAGAGLASSARSWIRLKPSLLLPRRADLINWYKCRVCFLPLLTLLFLRICTYITCMVTAAYIWFLYMRRCCNILASAWILTTALTWASSASIGSSSSYSVGVGRYFLDCIDDEALDLLKTCPCDSVSDAETCWYCFYSCFLSARSWSLYSALISSYVSLNSLLSSSRCLQNVLSNCCTRYPWISSLSKWNTFTSWKPAYTSFFSFPYGQSYLMSSSVLSSSMTLCQRVVKCLFEYFMFCLRPLNSLTFLSIFRSRVNMHCWYCLAGTMRSQGL